MIDRRRFMKTATAAGVAALVRMGTARAAAEPPSETTTIKLGKIPGICIAAQYVAEDLLRSEGFTSVEYVQMVAGVGGAKALATGQQDMTLSFVAPFILRVDGGDPIVMLAGIHAGCFELVGSDRVRAIRDLRGKTVPVAELGSSQHVFLSSMLAYVGLNPGKDVKWVTHASANAIRLLAEGRVDAYLAFPPETQELRARKIGQVVVNSAADRPWSQHFCCILAGNREFVRRYPVATKRAVRAILKAADICALEPERAARSLVDKGFTPRYEYALQTMKEVPYDRWRHYDPESAVRFYALRLREADMIKSAPQKIIAQGTDWRFLNELKKELKG